jgi:pimeloyl-ACP methyl ester carboxylesterase
LEPKSKYVEANGFTHHYLDWGNEGAQPVLMTHGIGLCAQIWNHAARALNADYHVLSLDLRAHGETQDPHKGYKFEDLGEDVAAVIKALGLKDLFGVGHSAGGMSLLVADSVGSGGLSKVMLIDTRVGDSPMAMLTAEERIERIKRTEQKRNIWESRPVMYEAYRNRRAFKTWTDEVFGDYINGGTRPLVDGTVEIKCSNIVEATFYDTRQSLDTSTVITSLGAEYMLAVGNYEGRQHLTDAAVQRLAEEAQGFSFSELPQGSHFVPMEHPDLVLDRIKEFLSQ